jgi:hypothetical protein
MKKKITEKKEQTNRITEKRTKEENRENQER